MEIAVASDIHGKFNGLKWPAADTLILAGDIMPNFSGNKQRDADIQCAWAHDDFAAVLRSLRSRYAHVIYVPGNHDRAFEFFPARMEKLFSSLSVSLLIEKELIIDGIKFWGSPYTPWFHGDHWAFNMPEFAEDKVAEAFWSKIPSDVDVLITHGPPKGILDYVPRGENVGCPYLRRCVDKISPSFHVFGHIHEGYGTKKVYNTMFINASVCNEIYKADNPIQTFSI